MPGKLTPKKPIPFPVSLEEIQTLGLNPRLTSEDRALFYTLYLTAARITEALKLTPRELQREACGEKKEALVFRLATLKNPNPAQAIRTLPVVMKGLEGEMAKAIIAFAKRKPLEEPLFKMSRTNAWKRIGYAGTIRTQAIKLPEKEIVELDAFRIHPHYLRHCRLTHLVIHYGYSIPQLMQFAGWSDPKSAMIYVALDWQSLAKQMAGD